MELSQFMAERLYSGFVSKTEQPEDFRIADEGYRFGGQWFCPGCGVLMNEETPGAVKCPQCKRNIGSTCGNWWNYIPTQVNERYRLFETVTVIRVL